MYKKIVVPLDGSPAAECVLAHVSNLAGKGAKVILVRVVAKPSYDYVLTEPQLSACLDNDFTQEASQYLAGICRTMKTAGTAERIVHHGKIPVLIVHP